MSFSPSQILALDIETSTEPVVGPESVSGLADYNPGLNPLLGFITEIAIKGQNADDDVVFDGAEASILARTDAHLTSLPAGLIATWNGGPFDLPFIATRVAIMDPWGTGTYGMALSHQDGLKPKYDALPGHGTKVPGLDGELGHSGVYSATWTALGGTRHAHLDVSYAYKGFAEQYGIKFGLKPVCEALGIPMIEVDRERMHLLSEDERRAYVLSDVNGTRLLALGLLGHIDLGFKVLKAVG
jgi:hypothetical protein